MKINEEQVTLLYGHLADEINAISEYVAFVGPCDNTDHGELHRAILDMHKDFPAWLAQRIAFMDHASVTCTIVKGLQS